MKSKQSQAEARLKQIRHIASKPAWDYGGEEKQRFLIASLAKLDSKRRK